MTASPLTKAELEITRTAADMRSWVAEASERFGVTEELRHLAYSGGGFAKQLWQEALPISLFALQYYGGSREVWITHVIGDQNYDAVVDDRRSQPGRVKLIEVTDSIHDYTESLRLELLAQDGIAPSFGPVTVVGLRHNRLKVEAALEAYPALQLRAEQLDKVRQAVKRKAAKTYAPNTALVVNCADHSGFATPEYRAELARVAEAELVPLVDHREYCVLAFVGASGLFISFDLAPARA